MSVCSFLSPTGIGPQVYLHLLVSCPTSGGTVLGYQLFKVGLALPPIRSELTAQGSLMARSRLPITPVILRKLRVVWDSQSSFLHLLLWTTATVAFFGFMRLGEVTTTPGSHPSIVAENVAVDSHHSPTIIRLTVHRSKTDPFGKGAMVFLGKTDDELCPVSDVPGKTPRS